MATSILKISGIGPATAATLADFGFKTAETLAAAKVDQLSLVPGFGAIRAQSTIADAMSILGNGATTGKKADDSSKKGKGSKKKGKDKKSKKDKSKKSKSGDKKGSSSKNKKQEKDQKKHKKGKNKRNK
ncbi:MAG: helix-hairpin-helix domain-containing protein [Xanthomonadales bacterium]|nr:helix-hairpin-helix domain-containing protein [Xanthomonadales bacterium]